MHDLGNDYTLAGDKIEVTKQMVYKYQLEIIEDNNFCLGKKIPILGNKRKCKFCYQNLKFHLNLVLQLKTIIEY